MNGKDFEGKVVWITGASSGIGEALAYNFAGRGASVALSSNEEDELRRVAGNCGTAAADRVMPLYLDLSDFGSMEGRTREVLERFGQVDVLVNNGGISIRSMAKDTPLELDMKVMDIDFIGQVALTKAVLPSMIERKSGNIVVTSSVMGLVSVPLRSSYCAAKHALHGYFDTLRTEVHGDGIRVLLVCPAGVQTGITKNALTSDGGKYGKMDPVVQHGITPEDCAEQVIRAMKNGRELLVPGKFSQKYFVYVHRYFPSLFSFLIKRRRNFT